MRCAVLNNLNNFILTPCLAKFFRGDTCVAMFSFFSEDVLPSIHADPEYPCELVGTWNTWYGEQDQAGMTSKNGTKKPRSSTNNALEVAEPLHSVYACIMHYCTFLLHVKINVCFTNL